MISLDSAFRFNPEPQLSLIQLAPDVGVIVVDNALLEPHLLRQFAVENAHEFQPAPFNAFPGDQFPFVEDLSARLNDFFIRHVRAPLSQWMNIRRGVRMWSRLSMVSLPPTQLQPRQSICHRDSADLEPNQSIAASVLYLFEDATLGGTCFFKPKGTLEQTALLVHQSSTLSAHEFYTATGIAPGYHTHSNNYFDCIGHVPAKFNRMIFYNGGVFHSGQITAPERLSSGPMTGRLTLNGFFVCTQNAR